MEDYQDLIKSCLKGDIRAQKELYSLFSKKMMGVCLRYASDYEEAKDLLQEGFLKVFNNLREYEGKGSFEGWIRRIIINVCLMHLRKVRPIMDSIDDVVIKIETPIELHTKDLLKFIQSLPNGFRMVFNLYAVEGYSHKEISEILDISEGTSKSQYSRARAILQNKIKTEERISA